MIEIVVVLYLRVQIWRHALYWRKMLPCWCWGSQATWGSHVEAIGDYWHLVLWLLHRVHLAPADIFARNDSGLVLERDAIVVALWYEICIALACGVEEVELLAPVALALRLGAVVAAGLRLIALEMPLSAGQTAGARALGLAVGRGIAVALVGRHSPAARRRVAWWGGYGSRHVALLS